MEAPENVSPKDLPLCTHFAATLWDRENGLRTSGKLFLLTPGHQAYDCIFEPQDPTLLEHMSKYGTEISVGNLQKQKVKPVGHCASDTDPHIHLSWTE